MSRSIAGRTLAEWAVFARRDDCLERMVPSDLRQLIGAIPPAVAETGADAPGGAGVEGHNAMTNEQIKHMVDRFLSWRLPKTFNPDNGISYTRPNYAANVDATPSGTNLFDAAQADAMVRYMLEGLPGSSDHPDTDKITENVGRWLSAALDDPQVCEEMKGDIRAWMDAGMPNVQPSDVREAFGQIIDSAMEWRPGPSNQSYIEARADFQAMLNAALRPAWQPIETAPRDGTPFLCFHPDDVFSPQTGIDLIWFEPSIKTYTMDGDNEVPFAGITHWVPLPVAPLDSGLSTDTSSSRSPSLHREPLLNNSSDTTLSAEGMREALEGIRSIIGKIEPDSSKDDSLLYLIYDIDKIVRATLSALPVQVPK